MQTLSLAIGSVLDGHSVVGIALHVELANILMRGVEPKSFVEPHSRVAWTPSMFKSLGSFLTFKSVHHPRVHHPRVAADPGSLVAAAFPARENDPCMAGAPSLLR
jgi:hypothetical protein